MALRRSGVRISYAPPRTTRLSGLVVFSLEEICRTFVAVHLKRGGNGYKVYVMLSSAYFAANGLDNLSIFLQFNQRNNHIART
mgnify:FL=1